MQPVVTVDEENLILDLRSQGLNKDRIAIAVYGSRSANNVARVSFVVDEAPDEDEDTPDEEEIDRFCAVCSKYISGTYLVRQATMTYDYGRDIGTRTYYPIPGKQVYVHARCLSTKNAHQYPPARNDYPQVPEDPMEVMRREQAELQARTGQEHTPNKYRKLTPDELEEYYARLAMVEGEEVADRTRRAHEQFLADGGTEGRETARIEAETRRLEAQAKREALGKVVVYRSGDTKYGNLTTITRDYARGTEQVSQQRGGKTTKYTRPITKFVVSGSKTVRYPKRPGIMGSIKDKLGV